MFRNWNIKLFLRNKKESVPRAAAQRSIGPYNNKWWRERSVCPFHCAACIAIASTPSNCSAHLHARNAFFIFYQMIILQSSHFAWSTRPNNSKCVCVAKSIVRECARHFLRLLWLANASTDGGWGNRSLWRRSVVYNIDFTSGLFVESAFSLVHLSCVCTRLRWHTQTHTHTRSLSFRLRVFLSWRDLLNLWILICCRSARARAHAIFTFSVASFARFYGITLTFCSFT